jgi:glycosyltransferase involved in cell wall biosynthesis
MANIIVLTSNSESFPNVLVEGQALGLAAVTFDVGAANEIVLDGVTGYVVQPGDRNEYTRRLTELFSNHDHCRDMGKKGQKRVSDLFGMQRKVDRFLGMVYEDIQISSSNNANRHRFDL